MDEVHVQIKIGKHGLLPTKGSKEAAGYDLYVCKDFELFSETTGVIKLGIFTAIPSGYEAQIRGRSGLAKEGINVTLGTVDSDYRGEWGVIIENTSYRPFKFKRGDRIAQVVFNKLPTVVLKVVDELDDTERGAGGFGSTGV